MVATFNLVRGKTIMFFLFFTLSGFAQVNLRDYVVDSLFPQLEYDYPSVRDFYLGLDAHSDFDPKEMETLLIYALRNNDTTFFLNTLTIFQEKYGFTISLDHNMELYNEVYRKGLSDKKGVLKDAKSLYYAKNNRARFINDMLNKAYNLDQVYRISYYAPYRNPIHNNEVIINTLDSMLYMIDNINFLIFNHYCVTNKVMINNFDFGNSSHERFQFILAHRLRHKDKDFVPLFELLNVNGVNAYIQNKINSSVFKMFDKIMNDAYGFQVFGFMKNVPVNKDFSTNIKGPYYK